jgi:adenine deaminase
MMHLGGGLVVVDRGEVTCEVPLACGGVMHTGDVPEVAEQLRRLNQHLQDAGCPWDDPFFATAFLTYAGVPYARMTPAGLLDTREKTIVYPPAELPIVC